MQSSNDQYIDRKLANILTEVENSHQLQSDKQRKQLEIKQTQINLDKTQKNQSVDWKIQKKNTSRYIMNFLRAEIEEFKHKQHQAKQNYLKNQSVEQKPDSWEKQSEKWKDEEIFILRVGFLLQINGFQ